MFTNLFLISYAGWCFLFKKTILFVYDFAMRELNYQTKQQYSKLYRYIRGTQRQFDSRIWMLHLIQRAA